MRDYDPTTGRYIQADPLGLVDGASVYGYALQNPGRYTDPRGEQAIPRPGLPLPVPGGSMPTAKDYTDALNQLLDWSDKYNPVDLAIQGIVEMCTTEPKEMTCKSLVHTRTGITSDGAKTSCTYDCPDGKQRTIEINGYGSICPPSITFTK